MFTKADSTESTRFGGLFHAALQPLLAEAAEAAGERHRVWAEAAERYDADLAAHDQSVAARDAAVAEGDGAPPTTLPRPSEPEGDPVPEFRWAGSGNAGVRSWTRPDGADQLAVLRHGGSGPAALVEFLYVTNPSEEALLTDPAFLDAEAAALADAITRFLAGQAGGSGFVADQVGDQPIGGGGRIENCVEPPLE